MPKKTTTTKQTKKQTKTKTKHKKKQGPGLDISTPKHEFRWRFWAWSQVCCEANSWDSANELMLRLVSFLFSIFFFFICHSKFAAKLLNDSHSPPLDLTEATPLKRKKKRMSEKWVAAQCGNTSDSDKDISSTETFFVNHQPRSYLSSFLTQTIVSWERGWRSSWRTFPETNMIRLVEYDVTDYSDRKTSLRDQMNLFSNNCW